MDEEQTGTPTLSDDEMTTEMGSSAPTAMERKPGDGTDGDSTDATDGDSSDGTDGDAMDGNDGDSSDADGTDSQDADGTAASS